MRSVGKLKIIAKTYMLGNTLPILAIFVFALSAAVISGDFSFLFTNALRLVSGSNAFENLQTERILTITLSAVGIVISALIIPPLKLGLERWFFIKGKGEAVRVRDAFYFFSLSYFLRCQSAFWYATTIKAGVFLFLQFPTFCVFGILYYALSSGSISYMIILSLAVAGVILLLSGLLFYFIYSAQWLMYYYIIVSNDTIKLDKAYNHSINMTKNSVHKICLFKLSFLPWWLLCALIFPAFYVWGYYKQSLAVLAYRNEYLK